MEFADEDLLTHLKAEEGRFFPRPTVRSIFRQAMSALKYLHGLKITHGNIDPSKILITNWEPQSGAIKVSLSDFGLAYEATEPKPHSGKENDQVSEISIDLPPASRSTANDIYLMGGVLEYITGLIPPSSHMTHVESLELVSQLISWMRKENPRERPTVGECLDHPWERNGTSDGQRGKKRAASGAQSPAEPSNKRIAGTASLAAVGDSQATFSYPRSDMVDLRPPEVYHRFSTPVADLGVSPYPTKSQNSLGNDESFSHDTDVMIPRSEKPSGDAYIGEPQPMDLEALFPRSPTSTGFSIESDISSVGSRDAGKTSSITPPQEAQEAPIQRVPARW